MEILQIKTTEFNELVKSINGLKTDLKFVKEKLDDSNGNLSEYIDIKEAGKRLKKSDPTMRRIVSKREIPFIRNGKKIFFKVGDLIDYLESRRVKSVEELEKESSHYFNNKK